MGKFVYKRDEARANAVKKRATSKGGGDFDNPVKPEFPVFVPKDGDFTLRILPPTWKGAEDYGYEVGIHYGVGVDNGRFVCLKRFDGSKCPACQEYENAKRNKDEDTAKALRANTRVFVWIIDRDNEQDGPKVFPMPFTLAKDLAARCHNKKTNEVLFIDDPEEGYDFSFSRETKGKLGTKYIAIDVARKPSPISDNVKRQDRWLEYIQENPIPSVLEIADYDYMKEVLEGAVSKKDKDEDEDDDRPRTRRSSKEDEDDDRPSRSRYDEKDEDDDRPRRKKASEDIDDPDEDLDEPRRRSKSDDDDDRPSRRKADDDEDDKPRRRSRDDDEDDDRPSRRSKDDDEDDDKPRRSSRDDDEDDRPSRRKADDDEDDRPSRRKADDDEDDDKPLRRRPSKGDDEDDRPRRRDDDEDDDKPRRSKSDDDEDDKPKRSRLKDDEDDEEDNRSSRRKRSDDDD